MKRRQGDGCPVMGALQWVGDRWTLMVVRDLARGPRRTTELLATLHPISSRTLVERLREMERAALVERREFNGSPPHVEYALTDRGKLLLPLLDALRRVGEALGCCACEDRRRQRGSYCEACPRRNRQTAKQEVPVVLL